MFWKINFRQPSAIDGLLDKEDCTLMEILDEDDVLQECKTQNKKLIDFLCKPENLQQLVQYICVEPGPDEEDKVRFKYPHLACEILTAEVIAIIDALSTSDMFLPRLWHFLDCEPPMNPLTGSFISKVLIVILNQRTEIFLSYISKREGFLDSFLRHIGTSAIMDLLLQMIVCSDGDKTQQSKIDLVTWLKDAGIIEKLFDCIHPEASLDQCINASQAVCDMISISRDTSQTTVPLLLLSDLSSGGAIERLLDNMFANDNPPDWTIINGIMILLTTLEKRVSTGYTPTLVAQSEESNSLWDQAIDKTLLSICPRIKNFHDLLSRKPSCQSVLFTLGTLDPPLGNMRLRVVQLMSALLQSQEIKVHREIMRLETCSVLLDLFFQYPWNNFLHLYVESSISIVLSSSYPIPLDTNDDTGQPNDSITLRQHLLKECQLVQRLLAGADFNDQKVREERGCRQGYMGHLIRMANQIAGNPVPMGINMGSLTRNNGYEENRLQEDLDEETFIKWSEFISGPLTDINKKNSSNLGGNRPINSSIEDSDEEFDPLNMTPDNELEKAFQQYQEIHFTNQFVDEFGADDNLDPAPIPYSTAYTNITSITCSVQADEQHTQSMAGFEAACSDRIHQFDDESESDDDESSTWVEKDLSFTSPADIHSPNSSSGEDEEGGAFNRRRNHFRSESSDDDDDNVRRRKPLIIEENKTSNGSNDLGVISWRSEEFTTDEDLSGVTPIETTGGALDWSQEPVMSANTSTGDNWANFNDLETTQEEQRGNSLGNVPSVVTTTYVSVTEVEASTEGGHCTRLSSGGSDGDIVVDPILLQMDDRCASSESSEDELNSSDEDRSGSYQVTEGDSGNPLIETSPDGTPTKPQLNKDNTEELKENYRFLSSKGLISDKVNTETATVHSTNRLSDTTEHNPDENTNISSTSDETTPPVS